MLKRDRTLWQWTGLGKSLYPFKQFIVVDEDCFNWKKKRKKEEGKHEKNKDGYKNINNKQQKENGWKERCYVLCCMVVTLPVFQLEMSWLNAVAW